MLQGNGVEIEIYYGKGNENSDQGRIGSRLGQMEEESRGEQGQKGQRVSKYKDKGMQIYSAGPETLALVILE